MSRVRVCVLLASITTCALGSIEPSPVHAALPNRTTLTIDCSIGEPGEDDHGLAAGETLTVTAVNCIGAKLKDEDNTGNAITIEPSPTTLDSSGYNIPTSPFQFTVFENADIDFDVDPTGANVDIDLDVFSSYAGPETIPSGDLLATASLTLSGDLREFTVTFDDGAYENTDEILLGGVTGCEITIGSHVFTELQIEVSTSGTYTFRKIWIDPIEEDLFWGVPTPQLGDSFLALYSGFDSSQPEANLIACNDDINELPSIWGPAQSFKEDKVAGSESMADVSILSASGYLLDDQFPWMVVPSLAPGRYSLVVTGFSPKPASEWTGTETIAYELWGPRGGLRVAEESMPEIVDDDYLEHLLGESTEQLPSTR